MRLDADWYDFRDLGNTIGSLLEQIRDWGAPDWVPYVVSGLIGVVAILLWTVLSVLAFIWIERRGGGLLENTIAPNPGGPHGPRQTLADSVELRVKEPVWPRAAERRLVW